MVYRTPHRYLPGSMVWLPFRLLRLPLRSAAHCCRGWVLRLVGFRFAVICVLRFVLPAVPTAGSFFAVTVYLRFTHAHTLRLDARLRVYTRLRLHTRLHTWFCRLHLYGYGLVLILRLCRLHCLPYGCTAAAYTTHYTTCGYLPVTAATRFPLVDATGLRTVPVHGSTYALYRLVVAFTHVRTFTVYVCILRFTHTFTPFTFGWLRTFAFACRVSLLHRLLRCVHVPVTHVTHTVAVDYYTVWLVGFTVLTRLRFYRTTHLPVPTVLLPPVTAVTHTVAVHRLPAATTYAATHSYLCLPAVYLRFARYGCRVHLHATHRVRFTARLQLPHTILVLVAVTPTVTVWICVGYVTVAFTRFCYVLPVCLLRLRCYRGWFWFCRYVTVTLRSHCCHLHGYGCALPLRRLPCLPHTRFVRFCGLRLVTVTTVTAAGYRTPVTLMRLRGLPRYRIPACHHTHRTRTPARVCGYAFAGWLPHVLRLPRFTVTRFTVTVTTPFATLHCTVRSPTPHTFPVDYPHFTAYTVAVTRLVTCRFGYRFTYHTRVCGSAHTRLVAVTFAVWFRYVTVITGWLPAVHTVTGLHAVYARTVLRGYRTRVHRLRCRLPFGLRAGYHHYRTATVYGCGSHLFTHIFGYTVVTAPTTYWVTRAVHGYYHRFWFFTHLRLLHCLVLRFRLHTRYIHYAFTLVGYAVTVLHTVVRFTHAVLVTRLRRTVLRSATVTVRGFYRGLRYITGSYGYGYVYRLHAFTHARILRGCVYTLRLRFTHARLPVGYAFTLHTVPVTVGWLPVWFTVTTLRFTHGLVTHGYGYTFVTVTLRITTALPVAAYTVLRTRLVTTRTFHARGYAHIGWLRAVTVTPTVLTVAVTTPHTVWLRCYYRTHCVHRTTHVHRLPPRCYRTHAVRCGLVIPVYHTYTTTVRFAYTQLRHRRLVTHARTLGSATVTHFAVRTYRTAVVYVAVAVLRFGWVTLQLLVLRCGWFCGYARSPRSLRLRLVGFTRVRSAVTFTRFWFTRTHLRLRSFAYGYPRSRFTRTCGSVPAGLVAGSTARYGSTVTHTPVWLFTHTYTRTRLYTHTHTHTVGLHVYYHIPAGLVTRTHRTVGCRTLHTVSSGYVCGYVCTAVYHVYRFVAVPAFLRFHYVAFCSSTAVCTLRFDLYVWLVGSFLFPGLRGYFGYVTRLVRLGLHTTTYVLDAVYGCSSGCGYLYLVYRTLVLPHAFVAARLRYGYCTVRYTVGFCYGCGYVTHVYGSHARYAHRARVLPPVTPPLPHRGCAVLRYAHARLPRLPVPLPGWFWVLTVVYAPRLRLTPFTVYTRYTFYVCYVTRLVTV